MQQLMNDPINLVIFAGGITISLIVMLICWKPVNRQTLEDIYPSIIRKAAFLKATYGKTPEEIFTQKGTLRTSVKKEIGTEMSHLWKSLDYTEQAFCRELEKHGMVRRGQIKVKDVKPAAKIMLMCVYRAETRLNTVRRDEEIPLREFLNSTANREGDSVGVYVIHNITNGKYYVGQAKRLRHRVCQHFAGKGSPGVYADYVKGHEFCVRTVCLNGSGYDDIDRMEKDYIMKYRASSTGYNRTNGNGSL